VANLKDVSEAFKGRSVPTYYKVLEHYYSLNSGPYLLGDKISYADFAVYQSIENSEKIGVQVSELWHLKTSAALRKNADSIPSRSHYPNTFFDLGTPSRHAHGEPPTFKAARVHNTKLPGIVGKQDVRLLV
jgi:hypothetical protein